MPIADNPYSRFVAWSKIILPLLALALLSTLFLFARRTSDPDAIPYADIEEIAREPRLAEPRFSGVAADGSTIAISASAIRPVAGQPDSFRLTMLQATIDATDGSHIDMRAGAGEIDGRARVARLTGLARLTATSGYMMETSGIEADLDSGTIRSLGPLEVRTPYGALTAGALTITNALDGTGQQMVFSGGVRLLYDPQQQGTPP